MVVVELEVVVELLVDRVVVVLDEGLLVAAGVLLEEVEPEGEAEVEVEVDSGMTELVEDVVELAAEDEAAVLVVVLADDVEPVAGGHDKASDWITPVIGGSCRDDRGAPAGTSTLGNVSVWPPSRVTVTVHVWASATGSATAARVMKNAAAPISAAQMRRPHVTLTVLLLTALNVALPRVFQDPSCGGLTGSYWSPRSIAIWNRTGSAHSSTAGTHGLSRDLHALIPIGHCLAPAPMACQRG